MEFRITKASSHSLYGDTTPPCKNAYVLKEINPNICFMSKSYYVYAIYVNNLQDIKNIMNETGKSVVIDDEWMWTDGWYPTIVIYDAYIE